MAPSSKTQALKSKRNARSCSLSLQRSKTGVTKRSLSVKHKEPSIVTTPLVDLSSNKQKGSHNKTPDKTNSVPTGQSPSVTPTNSRNLSPLNNAQVTTSNNLQLGSARGGNDLSLFSPFFSRAQKRSHNR